MDSKKCIIWGSRVLVGGVCFKSLLLVLFCLSWKVGVMIQFEEHGFSNAMKPPPSNIA